MFPPPVPLPEGEKGGGGRLGGVLNHYVFYLCNLRNLRFLFTPVFNSCQLYPPKSLAYCVWIDIIYFLYLALLKSTGLVQ